MKLLESTISIDASYGDNNNAQKVIDMHHMIAAYRSTMKKYVEKIALKKIRDAWYVNDRGGVPCLSSKYTPARICAMADVFGVELCLHIRFDAMITCKLATPFDEIVWRYNDDELLDMLQKEEK